jgi:hypothetical protein
MGLLGWTFIVFLVLKLTDKIDWSWWWVTAPLWGPLAILVVFGTIFGIGYLIFSVFRSVKAKKARKNVRPYRRNLR